MTARSISETKQIRYLLGLSSPAEREHIELEYFENEDAFQEMLTAEDDLIDAYARGELAGEERRRFEKSFVSSLRGRERVRFAREFAGAVSTTRSVGTKPRGTLLDIFKSFQSPYLSRTATFAVVIVILAVLAWLVVDRRRMSNELIELRAESAELSKRTAALQQGERTRAAEIAGVFADLQAQSDKPKQHERGTAVTQQARHLPEIGKDRSQTHSLIAWDMSSSGGTTVSGTARDSQGNVVSGATVTLTDSTRKFVRTQSTNETGAYVFNAIPPGTYSIEVQARGFKTASVSGLAALLNTQKVLDVQLDVGAVSERVEATSGAAVPSNCSDATIGNSLERKRIIHLGLAANNVDRRLAANNVASLLSLQPRVTRTGQVNGGSSDQANIALDGVVVNFRIPSSLSWIRFQIGLKTPAIHEDYRVTLKTSDGRPITSVDWSEPLTPNQTIIDTPAISTADLSSNDCVLALMGKEPDGSFVKIAEYSFKVIKY